MLHQTQAMTELDLRERCLTISVECKAHTLAIRLGTRQRFWHSAPVLSTKQTDDIESG
jgi:hypothetical protein